MRKEIHGLGVAERRLRRVADGRSVDDPAMPAERKLAQARNLIGRATERCFSHHGRCPWCENAGRRSRELRLAATNTPAFDVVCDDCKTTVEVKWSTRPRRDPRVALTERDVREHTRLVGGRWWLARVTQDPPKKGYPPVPDGFVSCAVWHGDKVRHGAGKDARKKARLVGPPAFLWLLPIDDR